MNWSESRSRGLLRASLVMAGLLAVAGAIMDDARLARAASPNAADLQLFPAGTPVTRPVKVVLGQVRSHSCRYPYSPASADADAVSRLQVKALERGANGLLSVEVRPFQNGGKNPCWRGSVAEGTAVVFADSASDTPRLKGQP